MCRFPGVVVITSALHAEGLGFDPRGNFLPSFVTCMWNQKPQSITLTKKRMCRFPGVVVITSALHAEGLGFDPRGNLYHIFVTCIGK